MRKSTHILAAVAVAGMASAGGTAFTGTGVTDTTGGSQFIGGTVTQTVTGAVLSGVTYNFTDATHPAVSGITLTFAGTDAAGHVVSVTRSGDGTGYFTCSAIFDFASHGASL